jgi:hypothetical protein
MSVEPIRLLDDAGTAGALQADLAAARAAHVQGLDIAGGLAQLHAAVGAETGVIPAVGAASGSATGKVVLGAVAVAVVAWFGLRDPSPVEAPVPTVASPAAAPVADEPAKEAQGAASVRPSIAVTRDADAPTPARDAVPPEEAPDADVAVEPAAAVVIEAEAGAEAEPAPSHRPHHVARRPDKASPPATADSVLEEAKQVQAARRALAGDPAEALRLTQSIAKQFPKGQLIEERRALAIRALVSLGRTERARTEAEAFLVKYGRGPHAAAVRTAVGIPAP